MNVAQDLDQPAATDSDGSTGQRATWLANLMLDDVPPSIRERAKYLTLARPALRSPWSARSWRR